VQTKETATTLNLRLKKDRETLAKYKQVCDDDVKDRIGEVSRKNDYIAKRLISVYGKFEELLTQEGKSGMRAEHTSLNAKYDESLEALENWKTGLIPKLQEVQTRVSQGAAQGGAFNEKTSMSYRLDEQTTDEVSEDDLKDLLTILRHEREGIEALQESIQANTVILQNMNRELSKN